MTTAAPPQRQTTTDNTGAAAVVPVWLAPILQGVTIVAIVGATYTIADRVARLETKLDTLDRIETTLSDPNNGVSARLARLDERTPAIQRAIESLSLRSPR